MTPEYEVDENDIYPQLLNIIDYKIIKYNQKMEDPYELLQKAEAEKNRWTLWNTKAKYTTAGEYYSDAGASFFLKQSYDESGKAYHLAAEAYVEAGNKRESLYNYIHAGNAYEHTNQAMACNMFTQVKELNVKNSNFREVAKYTFKLANLLKNDQPEEAILLYEEASQYYKCNDDNYNATKCQIEMAYLHIKAYRYLKAAQLFEAMGTEGSKIPLLNFKCIEYFTNAIFCFLAAYEFDLAAENLELYANTSIQFSQWYRFNKLHDIVIATKSLNLQAFIDNLAEFDRQKPLENWQIEALYGVRKTITEKNDDIL